MNPDFRDMLSALSAAGAEFLIVGSHSTSAHGYPRATGDIGLWVRPTPENARRVWTALVEFGAPVEGLQLSDLSEPDLVLQIGVAPRRIELLTSIAGVTFEDAWKSRSTVPLAGGDVPVLSRELLIVNKRATGRSGDAADADWMEEQP